MALNKFKQAQTPTQNLPRYLAEEFRRVEVSIDSVIFILAALGVPVEIGPADSGGTGYRVLRIPN